MTLLIKNGLVYGGGEEPRRTDIFIRGSRIVRFGIFSRHSADRILDASGAVVMPGFVDIGSDFDHYFGPFSHDIQKEFIRRGITTVIGGNFGVSLAPFARDFPRFFYRPSDLSVGGVNWNSFGELLKVVGRQRNFLNFGTLIGYASVKSFFTHGEVRDLTDRERVALQRLVARSLRDGAFGLSFDFEYPFGRGVLNRDFLEIGRELLRARTILAVHFSRDDSMCRQAEFVLGVAKETGVSLEISGLELDENGCGIIDELLDAHTAQVSAGFDLVPLRGSVFPIFYFLPARLSGMSLNEVSDALKSGHIDKELIQEFKEIEPGKVRIGYVPSHLRFLRGKTLKEFAAARNIPRQRALVEFLKLSKMEAVVGYEDKNFHWSRGLMNKPNAVFSTGGFVTADLEAGRFFGVKMLKEISKEYGESFPKVLARVTELPARKFNIHGRGSVEEGRYADLLVVRGDEICQTIVNGQVVFDNGRFTGAASGRVLSRQ